MEFEELEDRLDELDKQFSLLWHVLVAHDPAFAEKLAGQIQTGMDRADDSAAMLSYVDFAGKLDSLRKALGQI